MNTHPMTDMPFKGDNVIGNDIWIGRNADILPSVHIADGAIVGANSVVGSDVTPYTVVVENTERELLDRFVDELIEFMINSNGRINLWMNLLDFDMWRFRKS